MLKLIVDYAYNRYSRHFGKVRVVDFPMEQGGRELRCLFFDNGETVRYMYNKLLPGGRQERLTRRIWIPALKKILNDNRYDADLCVAVLPRAYEQVLDDISTFKAHTLVVQRVALSGSFEEVMDRCHDNVKQIRRKMEKRNYSSKVSKDPADFSFFYYNMYLPYTKRRFGEMAHYESFGSLKRFFESGCVLFILEEERPVAGAIIWFDGDTAVVRRVATIDGDLQYLKKDALFAIDYFAIRYAMERGCNSYDLMGSLSFLGNGVYLAKRSLGSIAYPETNPESAMYYCNLIHSERLAYFYSNVRPIVLNKESGELMGVVGVMDGETVDWEKWRRKYCGQGISGLTAVRG